MEGRRPRRPLVQMKRVEMQSTETFVPAAGEAAGPPIGTPLLTN
jgi:hypothetical protein